FQAEDGIRDWSVTGVQTCALPIYRGCRASPVLLAPMAMLLRDRVGRMAISAQVMRGILDSIAARLDEARDTSRYMTALLVFLGQIGRASCRGRVWTSCGDGSVTT